MITPSRGEPLLFVWFLFGPSVVYFGTAVEWHDGTTSRGCYYPHISSYLIHPLPSFRLGTLALSPGISPAPRPYPREPTTPAATDDGGDLPLPSIQHLPRTCHRPLPLTRPSLRGTSSPVQSATHRKYPPPAPTGIAPPTKAPLTLPQGPQTGSLPPWSWSRVLYWLP